MAVATQPVAPQLHYPEHTFPYDLTTMLKEREKFPWLDEHFEKVRATTPGFLIGNYPQIYRNEWEYIYDYSDRFMATMYPTRGLKGVSCVIPNCYVWAHSLFVNDPKKENMFMTAWWRRHMLGQRIFIVDPYDTTGIAARVNLMDEVREGTINEIRDAYTFADAVVDPDGKGMDDPHSGTWKKRARDLLTAIILHVKYAAEFEGRRSLTTCIDFLTDPSSSFEKKLHMVKTYPHDPDYRYCWTDVYNKPTRTHPYIAARVQQQIDRPPAEGGSVKSENESYLTLYQENLARINTTTSDFSMKDIMDGPVPSTIYMCVNPQDAKTAMPFIRLFFNLMINRNLGDVTFDVLTGNQKPVHAWRLGMLLDEFTSVFGKLDIFSQQLAYIAGYGFKPLIVIQDKLQLDETYGDKNNIVSNIDKVAIGAMRNHNSAKYFSDFAGNATVGSMSQSRNPPMASNPSGEGHSFNTMARPLFDAQQLSNIPRHEALLFTSEHRIVPFRKVLYYEKDSGFAHCRIPFLGEQSDRIPFHEQRTQLNRQDEMHKYIAFCQERSRRGTLVKDMLSLGDQSAGYMDMLTKMKSSLHEDQASRTLSVVPE